MKVKMARTATGAEGGYLTKTYLEGREYTITEQASATEGTMSQDVADLMLADGSALNPNAKPAPAVDDEKPAKKAAKA
jgi:hypothetical protein